MNNRDKKYLVNLVTSCNDGKNISTSQSVSLFIMNMNPKTNKKEVRFSTVNIREYENKISFNPSCSQGPALELGWEYKMSRSFDVDDYEENHPSIDRKTPNEMLISPSQRDAILKEIGYSRRQIEDCTRIINASRPRPKSSKNSVSKSIVKMILHPAPRPQIKKRRILTNSAA